MKRRHVTLALAASFLGLASIGAGLREDARSTPPPTRQAHEVPRVALLSVSPTGAESALYFVSPGEKLSSPVARIHHAEAASVRGAMIPNTERALVIADVEPEPSGHPDRDRSYDAALFLVGEGLDTRRLTTGLVSASRPIVTPRGRIAVVRGEKGERLGERELRIDRLSLEVWSEDGSMRALFVDDAYLLFVAGVSGDELIIYRVRETGADLLAIHSETGASRTVVASLPAFARDFSIDAATRKIVFVNREDADPTSWKIVSVGIDDGKEREIARGPSMRLLPFAWPGGELSLTRTEEKGSEWLDGRPLFASPGLTRVVEVSEDRLFAAMEHTLGNQGARPVAWDRGVVKPLPFEAGRRTVVVGLVEVSQ